MAANEIHQGDIGTVFELTLYDDTVIVDVSTATTKEVIFQKPTVNGVAGAVVTKTAQFKTDGTDGIIQYTTILDDLDTVGNWKVQAKVTLPSGTWRSDISKFRVHKNL